MDALIVRLAELLQHGLEVIEDRSLQDKTKIQSLKMKLFSLQGLIEELKVENVKLKQQIEILKGEKKC